VASWQALHQASPRELKARVDAERDGEPFVFFRDDEGEQQIVSLAVDTGRITIGRAVESDVPLPWDGEVSRLHAELECIHGQWTVVDDGRSRNGTFLNDERISGRRRLRDGDAVRVGRTWLLFRAPDGGESRRTDPAEEGTAPVLTEAQRRVLVAVCRPFAAGAFAVPASTRQIADELVISAETVKTHLRALFEAFGVEQLPQNQKRAELARRALERGVVGPGDLK
jgi:pSer/pThr/pTyr-binding forkhead associated (FHA) protein